MSCLITLSGLAKDCSNGIGGIQRVFIANASSVSMTDATEIEDLAIVSGGTKFKEYDVNQGTSSISETMTKDIATGVRVFQGDLSLQFPRYGKQSAIDEIEKLTKGELVVIVQMNGTITSSNTESPRCVVLGSPNRPAYVSAETGQTGTAYTDGEFYTLTISAVSTHPMASIDYADLTSTIIDYNE